MNESVRRSTKGSWLWKTYKSAPSHAAKASSIIVALTRVVLTVGVGVGDTAIVMNQGD